MARKQRRMGSEVREQTDSVGALTVEKFAQKRPFWPNLREFLDSQRYPVYLGGRVCGRFHHGFVQAVSNRENRTANTGWWYNSDRCSNYGRQR